jgi:5-methylcytosine-specific restriction endonuclease McrA
MDCLHCGASFTQSGRGRPRSWCYTCLPALRDWVDQGGYYCRAARLQQFKMTGIHYCCGLRAPRPEPTLKPTRPAALCQICGQPVPPRSRTRCENAECRAEAHRRKARARRADKDATYQAMKRREWRRRRAAKRNATTEAYDPLDIAERDRWRCSLCGRKIRRDVHYHAPTALTMDHVIPLSCGGHDVASNVRAAHRQCNSAKGNRAMPNGEQLRLIG